MEFLIPFKTPTVNHLYWHRGNIKILTSEAKKLRQAIIQIVKENAVAIPQNAKLKVSIEIYEDWYCLNGSVKRTDIMNREKFLIDSVFLGLEIDDRYIFEYSMYKIQSEEEKTIIKINLC